MKPSSILAVMLLATCSIGSAAPRFALIRVKDIYTGLSSTIARQEQIKKERDEIMKDKRVEDLRRVIAELQEIQAKLSDKDHPPDEETGRNLARKFEIKRQEAQSLQKEFESFREEQEKLINRKMVSGMRTSLNKIVEASKKVAKEKGYDSVFDSSGNTNTGVPLVLYSKASPDLTDDVKAALKDSEAAAPVKKPDTPDKH